MKYFIFVLLMSSPALGQSIYLQADEGSDDSLCPAYAYKHIREFQGERWESLTLYDFDPKVVSVQHDISGVLSREHERRGRLKKYKTLVKEENGHLIFFKATQTGNSRGRWSDYIELTATLELSGDPKMSLLLRIQSKKEIVCTYSKRKFN